MFLVVLLVVKFRGVWICALWSWVLVLGFVCVLSCGLICMLIGCLSGFKLRVDSGVLILLRVCVAFS